ncbi:hypothetical protein [uncultured Psychroserpens sp.]|uniref:hypothetical protein n=1 Tax=uncultured Psychroserpens sp. TaxID=255436 RepID=UPI0026042EBF|nr:hypothetical protein [uncultured Psychroserpens sp.]
MKNFELFVNDVVTKWRSEKKILLASGGLAGVSNREAGDLAEEYILRKVKALSPKYICFKSSGSQTPSDIYSVARRNGYWHIMLIQVKSSNDINAVYKLNKDDKKVFDTLAKFIKKQINTSEYMKAYKSSPIIISNGYAAVHRNETGKIVRHSLIEGKGFKLFLKNASKLNMDSVNKKIGLTHKL